jgi:ferritin-like metal-binding protein YciE
MPSQLTQQLKKHIDEGVAMERSVLRMLDSMLRTTTDPKLKRAIETHQRTTREHIERLRGRLSAYGSRPSLVRQAGGAAGATVKGAVDVVRRDKPARNARDGFATEQMEVAAYELLERVARKAGDEETAAVAQQNRAEDEAMAKTIAGSWDAVAEETTRAGGSSSGGGSKAAKAGQLVKNPIVLGLGSVAAGVLFGRRGGSSSGSAGPPLDTMTKAELQQRATDAGIEVRRDMTKQQLVEALEGQDAAAAPKKASPPQIQKFLKDVGYPAGRDQLVKEAERRGADLNVRDTLKRLPRKRFNDPTEVSEALKTLP